MVSHFQKKFVPKLIDRMDRWKDGWMKTNSQLQCIAVKIIRIVIIHAILINIPRGINIVIN